MVPVLDARDGALPTIVIAAVTLLVACGGGSDRPVLQSVQQPAAPTSGPPTIVQQTGNFTIEIGQTTNLAVVAGGEPPLAYQWRRDGLEIAGATGATLPLPVFSAAPASSTFTVEVRNALGSVTSVPIRVESGPTTALEATAAVRTYAEPLRELIMAARNAYWTSVSADGRKIATPLPGCVSGSRAFMVNGQPAQPGADLPQPTASLSTSYAACVGQSGGPATDGAVVVVYAVDPVTAGRTLNVAATGLRTHRLGDDNWNMDRRVDGGMASTYDVQGPSGTDPQTYVHETYTPVPGASFTDLQSGRQAVLTGGDYRLVYEYRADGQGKLVPVRPAELTVNNVTMTVANDTWVFHGSGRMTWDWGAPRSDMRALSVTRNGEHIADAYPEDDYNTYRFVVYRLVEPL